MKDDDPYAPVHLPLAVSTANNRPFYIYATSVVMLLWAGIYLYLQGQQTVDMESEGVALTPSESFARWIYDFNVLTIAVFFAISLAIVNGSLWVVLKAIGR